MGRKGKDDGGDGIEHVTAYHKELQLCLREHESKFDNAVLLAAGGAFTISAAFISDLRTPLSAASWLAISWFAWGLCLLAGVGGHLVGAHATKRVLDLLDVKEYDVKVLMSGKAAKYIRPLNVATFALLIVGFIAFGWFTFANLDFGGRHGDADQAQVNEQGRQQERQQEGRLQEGGANTKGAQRSIAGSEMAAPQTNDSQVRSRDDRQEDAAPAAPAAKTVTGSGPDSVRSSKASDVGRPQGAQRADSATGVAPAR